MSCTCLSEAVRLPKWRDLLRVYGGVGTKPLSLAVLAPGTIEGRIVVGGSLPVLISIHQSDPAAGKRLRT